jgi:phage-related minor tail protein
MVVDLVANISGFTGPMADASGQVMGFAGKLDTLGQSFTSVGDRMSVGLTLPLVALGAAAYKAFDAYDHAGDNIRASTGATGAALDSLMGSFDRVNQAVPNSVGEVSKAIADLNTRTGLTGKGLEDMAEQELKLSRMMKLDLGSTIAATTRLFGDWSIASDKQAGSLDYLFKVSQQTGIGFTRLGEVIVQYGAPLRQLGFGFENAAAMLGKWEREGVNVETVLAAMKMGIRKLAESGEDVPTAFAAIVKSIKEAKNETEGYAIAVKVFGARGGVDMFRAVKEGRFDVDALTKSLRESGETINKAWKDTVGPQEQLESVLKGLMKTLSDLANSLAPTLLRLAPSIESLAKSLAILVDGFSKLPQPVITATIAIFGIVAIIGPLIAIAGRVVQALSSLWTIVKSVSTGIDALTTFVGGLWDMLAGGALVGLLETGLAGLAATVGIVVVVIGALIAVIYHFRTEVGAALTATNAWLEGMETTMEDKLGSIGNSIERHFGNWVDWTIAATKSIASSIGDLASTVWQGLLDSYEAVLVWIADLPGRFYAWGKEIISSLVQGLRDAANGVSIIGDWLTQHLGGGSAAVSAGRALAMGFTTGLSAQLASFQASPLGLSAAYSALAMPGATSGAASLYGASSTPYARSGAAAAQPVVVNHYHTYEHITVDAKQLTSKELFIAVRAEAMQAARATTGDPLNWGQG